jgi:MFS family permease
LIQLASLLSLPRTVIVLGIAALLNDAASEMIAPLLPIFLTTTLGAGPAIVGLVEGVAETTASFLKLLSGRLADKGWNTKKLVVGGYTLSNASRPLIGLATGWSGVLLLRFLDRVGKGVRTAPRDAMIATSVPVERRGLAFGLHRGLDHAGAVLGPLIAFGLLEAGATTSQVFLASAIPGLCLLWLVSRLPKTPYDPRSAPPPLHWHGLDLRLRALIGASGGLALGAVPEAFLVLWAVSHGLETVWVPILWAVVHVVKAVIALLAGGLSDRLGRLPVVITGWGGRVVTLALIALLEPAPVTLWALFIGYGAALAFTEGAERALIGDFAPEGQKATAYGLYHLVISFLALPGAFLFGLIWEWSGYRTSFLIAALLTLASAGTLLWLLSKD